MSLPLLHLKGERADCFGNVTGFNQTSFKKNLEANYKVWRKAYRWERFHSFFEKHIIYELQCESKSQHPCANLDESMAILLGWEEKVSELMKTPHTAASTPAHKPFLDLFTEVEPRGVQPAPQHGTKAGGVKHSRQLVLSLKNAHPHPVPLPSMAFSAPREHPVPSLAHYWIRGRIHLFCYQHGDKLPADKKAEISGSLHNGNHHLHSFHPHSTRPASQPQSPYFHS